MGVYSNMAAREAGLVLSEASVSTLNPMECVANIYTQDQALFESLIEIDFAHAYNENGLISLTEADIAESIKKSVKGIWKKIVAVVQAAFKAIRNFFEKIISFLRSLVDKDYALAKKYKGKVSAQTVGSSEHKATIVNFSKYEAYRKSLQSKMMDTMAMIDNMIDLGQAQDADVWAEDVKTEFKIPEDVFVKDSSFKQNGADVMKAIDMFENGRKLCDNLEKENKEVTNEYSKKVSKLKKASDKAEKKEENGAEDVNALYTACSNACKVLVNASKAEVDLVKELYKVCRGIAIASYKLVDAAGEKKAKEDAKTEKQNEAALLIECAIAVMASDDLVDEAFAM